MGNIAKKILTLSANFKTLLSRLQLTTGLDGCTVITRVAIADAYGACAIPSRFCALGQTPIIMIKSLVFKGLFALA